MSPADQQQMAQQHQMQQMMAMQQHMMQQMMAMQSGQMPMQGMPMQGMPMPGMFQQSPSMQSLGGNGFMQPMQPPGMSSRPMSVASNSPQLQQGRSMTMLNPPSQWNENSQQRSYTMGSNLNPRTNYAGSVYGMNLAPGGPQAGYTPSIAPSERSNIGMPSRYRPVSIMDGVAGNDPANASSGRTQTMSSMTMGKTAKPPSPSPLAQTTGNVNNAAKNTIRVIEKPKGAPKSSQLRVPGGDDEDDEEGWAEMKRKREEMRKKRSAKNGASNGTIPLADIYQSYE